MSDFSRPPRTDGERMVWAAAYGAAWDRGREFKRKHGTSTDDYAIAETACDEAWGALHELREIAAGDGDFAEDARAVIGEMDP